MSVKTKSRYSRISISDKLQEAINQIQIEFPLYSVNDAIYFLLNNGYASWQSSTLKGKSGKNRFLKYKSVFGFSSKEDTKSTSNNGVYKDFYDSKYGK